MKSRKFIILSGKYIYIWSLHLVYEYGWLFLKDQKYVKADIFVENDTLFFQFVCLFVF